MRDRRRIAHSLALALAICAAAPCRANPVNPVVVSGSASFATSGNTLTVTNSANAIINWPGFSIGPGETTRFVQPSAASAVLNRVTGQDPSQILGQLQSNGRVFLINPNGILFGKDARIDVAALVASTLALGDQDFRDGRYVFSGDGRNGVVNLGTISTPAGGSVYLVGGSVRNEGVISSPKGEIILAAGQRVRLVDTATPNVQVEIAAPAGEALNLGSLLAGGGTIDIHAATVNQRGIISADALTRDDQGRIRLIASGTMTLGASSVTSAKNNVGGDGGFIETSGAHVHVEDGASVSTAAPRGNAGWWLIDPADFTIAASGGDLSGTTLSANLASGNIAILSSSGATAGSGDINVNDAVSWSAHTLTLTAARNININSVMTASGTSTLTLNTGTANGADSGVAGGTVKMGFKADGTFMGRVDFGARSGTGFLTINGHGYTVINSLGVAGSVTGTDLQGMSADANGYYALGSNIDAAPTAGWNAGSGFAPVNILNGGFDGLGHVITGLTINRPTDNAVGLFGSVGPGAPSSAFVRNVGVENVNITGGNNCFLCDSAYATGALAGVLGGATVSNSYSTGSVSGLFSVGGLVGKSGNATIEDSHSSATVSVTGAGHWMGGLLAFNGSTSTVRNSYSTGNVSGYLLVGGLVGENDGTLTNSYSTGNVSAGLNNAVNTVGGLVGDNYGPIINSYSTGTVTAGAAVTNIGGLVGQTAAGFPWSGTITSSYWDTTTSSRGNCVGSGSSVGCTGLPTASMKQQASFSGWDFTTVWAMTNGATYPHFVVPTIPAAPPSPPAAPPTPPAAPPAANPPAAPGSTSSLSAALAVAETPVVRALPGLLVQTLQTVVAGDRTAGQPDVTRTPAAAPKQGTDSAKDCP